MAAHPSSRCRLAGPWPLLVLALAGAPTAAPASALPPGDFRVTRWTTGEGMPQNTVNGISSSPERELWVATFGGLARLDGVRIHLFDLANLPGLSSDRITAIARAGGGALWIATQEGAVHRIASEAVVETVRPGGPGVELIAIAAAPDGSVYAHATNGAAWRISGGRAVSVLDAGGAHGYGSVVATRSGAVWAVSGRELVRLDVAGAPRVPLPAGGLCVGEREDGTLLVGLGDGFATVGTDGRAARARLAEPIPVPVFAVEPEGTSRVWVGTEEGALLLEQLPDGRWHPAASPLASEEDRSVRSLVRDRDGDLWVGTKSSGLFRVTGFPVRRFGAAHGLPAARAVVSDGAGGAWVGTGCRGVMHVAPSGEVAPLASPTAETIGCEQALMDDAAGRLHIVGRGRLFVREAGVLRERVLVPPLPDEPALLASRNGSELWVVSRGGSVVRLPEGGPRTDRLLPPGLFAAAVARDRSLWVGGEGAVYRVTPDRVETFSGREGVPPCPVRDVVPEPDGTVWIGTYGCGLGCLRDRVVRRITARDGLPDNAISRILLDGRDRIWLSGNRALAVAPRQELLDVAEGRRRSVVPVVFGPERGVWEGNYGAPAGFADRSGRLWFGTIHGVYSLDSTRFPFNRTPPSVRIERVLADLEPVPAAAVVRLPAGTARIRLEFSALGLKTPERVRYRVRFEGVDRDWVDLGTQPFATVPRSEVGEFRVWVAARNEDGVWSQRPATMRLRIPPVWWRTPWALAGGVIAAAALVAVSWRVRVARLERARQLLARMVDERTAELENANRLLEKTSRTDALTGLANRRHFLERAGEQAAAFRRTRRVFSVALADVDDFKRINDTHGHEAGDAVLREIARRIRLSVRETDHVARWGGEEFIFLLPETELRFARAVCEKACAAIARVPFELPSGGAATVTLTVGVAEIREDANVDACLSRADAALYEGKRTGKGRVVLAAGALAL